MVASTSSLFMQEMQRSFMGLPWTASVSEGTSTHTGKQRPTGERSGDREVTGSVEEGQQERGIGEQGGREKKQRRKDHKTSFLKACTCVYNFTCAPQVYMLAMGKEWDQGGMDDPEVTEHLPRSSVSVV